MDVAVGMSDCEVPKSSFAYLCLSGGPLLLFPPLISLIYVLSPPSPSEVTSSLSLSDVSAHFYVP